MTKLDGIIAKLRKQFPKLANYNFESDLSAIKAADTTPKGQRKTTEVRKSIALVQKGVCLRVLLVAYPPLSKISGAQSTTASEIDDFISRIVTVDREAAILIREVRSLVGVPLIQTPPAVELGATEEDAKGLDACMEQLNIVNKEESKFLSKDTNSQSAKDQFRLDCQNRRENIISEAGMPVRILTLKFNDFKMGIKADFLAKKVTGREAVKARDQFVKTQIKSMLSEYYSDKEKFDIKRFTL